MVRMSLVASLSNTLSNPTQERKQNTLISESSVALWKQNLAKSGHTVTYLKLHSLRAERRRKRNGAEKKQTKNGSKPERKCL